MFGTADNKRMLTETTVTNTKTWFNDFESHLLEDQKPSVYFETLLEDGLFPSEYPFSMIADLKKVSQQPDHHPEGDVFNHTMQVTDLAATVKHESEHPRAFMWAALLHDLGKIPTTKLRNGRITSYDHDKEGEKLARSFLKQCTDDQDFISRVCALVRWHMQVLFIANNLPFADLRSMLRSVRPGEIALLAYCDRLGRGKLTPEKIDKEQKSIKQFLARCDAARGRC